MTGATRSQSSHVADVEAYVRSGLESRRSRGAAGCGDRGAARAAGDSRRGGLDALRDGARRAPAAGSLSECRRAPAHAAGAAHAARTPARDRDRRRAGRVAVSAGARARSTSICCSTARSRSTSPGLCIPHPRLHERAFVLEPLCELAPRLVHPRLGTTVEELARRVRDPRAVVALRVDPSTPARGRRTREHA